MIRKLRKPVPVTGFFYGVWKGVLCGALGVAFPVFSQIVLPEQVEPPEKSENTSPSLPEPEEPSEAELKQLIRKLEQQNTGVGLLEEDGAGPVDRTKLDEKEVVYKTAPEVLQVVCNLHTGEQVWGEVKNRSFRVKNFAGDFPVFFHQVEEIRSGEDRKSFVFVFFSGDRLEGIPGLDLFRINLADGGERQLRINDVQGLKVLKQEP